MWALWFPVSFNGFKGLQDFLLLLNAALMLAEKSQACRQVRTNQNLSRPEKQIAQEDHLQVGATPGYSENSLRVLVEATRLLRKNVGKQFLRKSEMAMHSSHLIRCQLLGNIDKPPGSQERVKPDYWGLCIFLSWVQGQFEQLEVRWIPHGGLRKSCIWLFWELVHSPLSHTIDLGELYGWRVSSEASFALWPCFLKS